MLQRTGKISYATKHHFTDYIDIHTLTTNHIKYTFRRKDYLARLDRAYIKQENIQKILKYKIKPTSFSDHDAIHIQVIYGTRPIWGKGTWILNKEVLKGQNTQPHTNILPKLSTQ